MITELQTVTHPTLPGVVVRLLGNAKRGEDQQVLVCVEDAGNIPLHTHDVDARMVVVSGAATVLSTDSSIDGRRVGVGDVVEFRRDVPHGFGGCAGGFAFLSQNGGIVDASGDWDIAFN